MKVHTVSTLGASIATGAHITIGFTLLALFACCSDTVRKGTRGTKIITVAIVEIFVICANIASISVLARPTRVFASIASLSN
jgi:hypothetical protein